MEPDSTSRPQEDSSSSPTTNNVTPSSLDSENGASALIEAATATNRPRARSLPDRLRQERVPSICRAETPPTESTPLEESLASIQRSQPVTASNSTPASSINYIVGPNISSGVSDVQSQPRTLPDIDLSSLQVQHHALPFRPRQHPTSSTESGPHSHDPPSASPPLAPRPRPAILAFQPIPIPVPSSTDPISRLENWLLQDRPVRPSDCSDSDTVSSSPERTINSLAPLARCPLSRPAEAARFFAEGRRAEPDAATPPLSPELEPVRERRLDSRDRRSRGEISEREESRNEETGTGMRTGGEGDGY